jgi:N6-L-threonylcarbamoyladenine synthase
MALILAIETSCDDTAVAVVNGYNVLSNIISSQEVHNKWGGIVPELASREHISVISQIAHLAVEQADIDMSMIEAIAVTHKPGLSGSLVVGTSFAKGLAVAYEIPVLPIDHIEGHIFSCIIENPNIGFPFISLVVSGGHTSIFLVHSYDRYEIIGSTKDDAAGEAYDKTAKILGLGYPGGPLIDKLAKKGESTKYDFPRPMINELNYDFSFSGLKTSVRRFIDNNYGQGNFPPDVDLPDICASVQAAINEVLVAKTIKAAKKYQAKTVTVNGGVSANSDLRNRFQSNSKDELSVYYPSMEYTVDNAAMIGFIADMKIRNRISTDTDYGKLESEDLTFTVNPKPLRSRKN